MAEKKSPLHQVLDRVYRFPHNADMEEVLTAVYGQPTETNKGYLKEKRDQLVRKGFPWLWSEMDLANQAKVCDMIERRYGPFEGWVKQ